MGDEHKVKVIEMVEKQENGALGAVQYLVVVAIYSILGLAIDYWLFVAAGAATAWANPLTYMVMVFWPVVLAWKFLVIVFWLVIIVVVIFGLVAIFKGLI